MIAPARRRGVARIAQPPVVAHGSDHDADHQRVRRSKRSKRDMLNKEKQKLLEESQARALAVREKYASMDKDERRFAAALSIQGAWRTCKMRKLLPIMLECMRVARRWTSNMIFRLYTSLELQVEAERQARQLWQERFQHPVIGVGINGEALGTPLRVVFDNALTEEGFLGLARDLELLALPFAAHTGFISLFRRHASHMTQHGALRSRAKGLYACLCKSSSGNLLKKEDIARLLDALGLPMVSEQEAMPFSYANGTWDLNGLLRYFQEKGWITNTTNDDLPVSPRRSSNASDQSEGNDSCANMAGSDISTNSSSCDPSSSSSEATSSTTSGVAEERQLPLGIKIEGFENAMKEIACIIRPTGRSCECEGCRKARKRETERSPEPVTGIIEAAELARNIEETTKEHEMWAVVRLYYEILAPAAAKLFSSKACAANEVFGAALFDTKARRILCQNDLMLREIFLTLVGRQGDRDASSTATSIQENRDDKAGATTAALRSLRADCRANGFSRTWEQAVVAGGGKVGYPEVLRFCWDYGLHPSMPNSGEDNFLVAHLFVGASHASVRVVPDEDNDASENGEETYPPRLRSLVSDADVDAWLTSRKLDHIARSEDPALVRTCSQLSAGDGKVSPTRVRNLVQEFNIGLDRGLSPGELYTLVREMERSTRAAGLGNTVTIRTCFRAIAHTCIFTQAVTNCRLSFGEFTSLILALSQLQPGLSPAWCKSALYGIGAQDVAAMGECMASFLVKLESVHPALGVEGIRSERHVNNSATRSRNSSQAPRHLRASKTRNSCGRHQSTASIIKRTWNRVGLVSSWSRHKHSSPKLSESNLVLTKPSASAANDQIKATKDGVPTTLNTKSGARRSKQRVEQPLKRMPSPAQGEPSTSQRQRTPIDNGATTTNTTTNTTTTTSSPISDRGPLRTGALREARSSPSKGQSRSPSDETSESQPSRKSLTPREPFSGAGRSPSARSQQARTQDGDITNGNGRVRPLSAVNGVPGIAAPSGTNGQSRAGCSSATNASQSTESCEGHEAPSDAMGSMDTRQIPQVTEYETLPEDINLELDIILRSIFARYAALEPQCVSEGMLGEYSDEGNGGGEANVVQGVDGIQQSPATLKSRRGRNSSAVTSAKSSSKSTSRTSAVSSGRTPSAVPTGRTSRAKPSQRSPSTSTLPGTTVPAVPPGRTNSAKMSLVPSIAPSIVPAKAVIPSVLSVDGLLLFINDTNIFSVLNFEDIEATAIEYADRSNARSREDSAKEITESEDEMRRLGLDADGFVRVCLQLLRDNFLAKQLGFQHRVTALTSEQREREWEKRSPGIKEHDDLLRRLRGWVEHYKLPSRMASFKRDAFAISCPTETKPRAGSQAGGNRRGRTRPIAIFPPPGPCLIDLWTGHVVARKPVEGGKTSSGRIIKVDDRADRAIMDVISGKVVDMAVAPTVVEASTAPTLPTKPPTNNENHDDTRVDASKLGSEKEEIYTPICGNQSPIGGCRTRSLVSATGNSKVLVDTNDLVGDVVAENGDNGQIAQGATTITLTGSNNSQEDLSASPSTMGDKSGDDGGHAVGDEVANAIREEQRTAPRGKKGSDVLGSATAHDWGGQVRALESASKARFHRIKVSNTVGQILGKICQRGKFPRSTGRGDISEDFEESVDGDSTEECSDGESSSSDNGKISKKHPPKAHLTADDFTPIPNGHPSQTLLQAGVELMRLKRPEQAVVLLGNAAEILRNVDRADPRQRLVITIELASALEGLERLQDTVPVLTEAATLVNVIAGWGRRRRSNTSRRLKAAVMGKLGWAYISVEGFTHALTSFRDMEQVTEPQSMRREEIELAWGAKAGASTALVGLDRGREAYLEAIEALEFANQLSEDAMKAECKGLAGRALRSVAARITKDAECREIAAAFEALSETPQERLWKQQPETVPYPPNDVRGGDNDDRVVTAEVLPKLDTFRRQLDQEAENPSRHLDAASNDPKRSGANPTTKQMTHQEGDRYANLRKAAGCFERQVALLRSLDRFSTPIPTLEPQAYVIVDNGSLGTPSNPPTKERLGGVKMRAGENIHLSTLRALFELGQTALDLGQIDSAVEMFKRRLRLAEVKAPGISNKPHQQTSTSLTHDLSETAFVARPLTSPSKKCHPPTRPTTAPISSGTSKAMPASKAAAILSMTSQPATESDKPEARKVPVISVELSQRQLELAESLWWLSRAIGRQRFRIDIANFPRFLPLNAAPICRSTNDRTPFARAGTGRNMGDLMAGEGTIERKSITAPSRLESLVSKTGMTRDDASSCSRGVPTLGEAISKGSTYTTGGSNNRHGGSMVVLSGKSGTIRRRIRPRPDSEVYQPSSCMDGQRRRPLRPRTVASRDELKARGVFRDDERGAYVSWGCPESSPGHIFNEGDEEGIGNTLLMGNREGYNGITSGRPTTECDSRTPFLATSLFLVQQEADDGLLQGGRLWQESQFARVMELRRSTMDGAKQTTVDACQPIIECLSRQLAAATECKVQGGQMATRQQRAMRDAFMGLGTVAFMCENDDVADMHFERASNCCRSAGDWEGLAAACAAKARRNLCTGRCTAAINGFKLVLKLARELKDNDLAASVHSFLGWARAYRGDTQKALGHFCQWRRLAYRAASGPSAAAAELCIGHIRLRLAASSHETRSGNQDEGTQIRHGGGNPQNDIQDGPEEGPQLDVHNDNLHRPQPKTRHFQLCEAQRHYRRYLRWAQAIDDSRGISHANMCLARVYDVLGDTESASRHKNLSFEWCRRLGDTDNHGKMRAHEHEGLVRGMLQLND